MNLQVAGRLRRGPDHQHTFLPGGNQTISVQGQLNVSAAHHGRTASTNSGIFKNGAGGLQTVRAAGITLQGASTGTNAGARIRSQGRSADRRQRRTSIMLGGNGGTNNNDFSRRTPRSSELRRHREQTIYARDINISNGVGGIDTTATITAGKQEIHVTRNLTLTSQGALLGTAAGGPGVRIGAPGGTTRATDLTLRVGSNVMLNGGTVAENGASIGSSGAGVPPAPNNITHRGGRQRDSERGTRLRHRRAHRQRLERHCRRRHLDQGRRQIALNGTARSAAIRTRAT